METNTIALDCETEEWGAPGTSPRTVALKGISIAYNDDFGEYVTDPVKYPSLIDGTEETIFHHAKFDIPKIEKATGKEFLNWQDTKIAGHLINENRINSLKPLAKSLLGEEVVEYKDVDKENPDAFAAYAINDALYTRRLWPTFKEQLKEQELEEVYELEKSLVPVIIAMEDAGMLVDQKEFSKFGKLVAQKLEEAKTNVFKIILEAKLTGKLKANNIKQVTFVKRKPLKDGKPRPPKEKVTITELNNINLNSHQHIEQLLLKVFGLVPSVVKHTKSGQVSTDKEALGYFNHPLADAIGEYKIYAKLMSAFVDNFPHHIEADGRIHPEYNSTGTVTGRFSVANPNCQQIPARGELGKQLRNCFVAGRGKKLVVADYSAMELRVLAHYSKDKTLLDAFKNNKDPHSMTAQKIFNLKTVDKNSVERQIAKMVNFGVVYGISSMGLQRRLFALGIKKTEEECQHFINLYFQSHPGVRDFLEEVKHAVKRRGYVRTLYGRRRRLDVKSGREIRQAGNFVIQGSSADLIKQAMVDVHIELPKGGRIVAMIHDELVVECKAKDAEDVKEIITRCMENPKKKLNVPITVDIHTVNRWGDAK